MDKVNFSENLLRQLDNKSKGLRRDFKGVWIPREIWEAKDLSMNEKVLIAEIDSLDCGEGCFAGNEYFAKFIGVSLKRIESLLTELRKKGIIIDKKFDGRKRYMAISPKFSGRGKSRKLSTTP